MYKTDSLKNPVIVFHCKNCGCTTKIRVASFENPDLDIPENNVIACYRCRAEVAGSLFLGKKQLKLFLPWRCQMAVKIVKHGHEPEPQKFAIEFKCPYCHCDFYADDTFDSIYKDYYTTAANFELRYTCPECGETAKQIDIADYNEVFGKPTFFEWLRAIFETLFGRYYRIQKILKSLGEGEE